MDAYDFAIQQKIQRVDIVDKLANMPVAYSDCRGMLLIHGSPSHSSVANRTRQLGTSAVSSESQSERKIIGLDKDLPPVERLIETEDHEDVETRGVEVEATDVNLAAAFLPKVDRMGTGLSCDITRPTTFFVRRIRKREREGSVRVGNLGRTDDVMDFRGRHYRNQGEDSALYGEKWSLQRGKLNTSE
jgi:hypothetical protein